MKTMLQKLLLLGVSLGIALVSLEMILRWREARGTAALLADTSKAGTVPSSVPGLYYTLRPGASNKHFAFNSLGFNMPERPAAKPPGVWRLMIVGDSVTQGVGADNRDGAYPNRAEALLRERTGMTRLEVWNCGTGGYNVDQVFLMLSHIVPACDPDAVIYGFCFNDYWGPNYFVTGQAGRPPGADGGIGFLDRLKALRTVTQVKLLYDRWFYAVHDYLPVFVDRKTRYPSWVAMKRRIVDMRDFCAVRGWPFAVLILPMEQFTRVDDAENRALHDVRTFLGSNGIPFVDATPMLRAHGAEKLFVERDNHPNPRGYELIAEELAEWVSRRAPEFLPPDARP